MQKITKKRNHHYIPQFYQKLFSDNNKSVGKFVVDSSIYIPNASIRETGKIKYYYGRDNELEDYFMEIENVASIVIKKILKNKSIPPKDTEDYDILIFFIILLEARVQKIGDYSNNQISIISRIALEMEKANGSSKLQDINIENYDVKYTVPTLINLKAAANIYRIIADLNCCLVISDTSRKFITSDNPVVRYNYLYNLKKYIGNYGLGNVGIQLFFPISPKYCLYFYDDVMYNKNPNNDGNFHINEARYIDKLNLLFYMNSYSFLLFNNTVKNEYIKKLINGNDNLKTKSTKIPVFGDDKHKLILNETLSVKKYIFLPFFDINKDFINISLPPHMGGIMRPYAKKFDENMSKKKP
ncbi:MAG: DUF4238 domain-containing protein [Eubacteriales bacterium]